MRPESLSELRLEKLELQLRHTRLLAVLACLVATVPLLTAWTGNQQNDTIRTRNLIIEDSQGRPRVLLGAPIEGRRRDGDAGMIVVDSVGLERFGLTLRANGNMGMGFDAPIDAGDNRNRERINITANRNGGADIRFLNRKTRPAGYLQLGQDDLMYLDFLEYTADSVIQRRVGLKGDSLTRRALQRQ